MKIAPATLSNGLLRLFYDPTKGYLKGVDQLQKQAHYQTIKLCLLTSFVLRPSPNARRVRKIHA
ncbi:hypothetical protein DM813_17385 [Pseudomonas alkylphenolica]|uniref:Uncharacterized protein n=1 Tax=Pseudomonas alkylphenolica TaxID=237609 RepID=A0A443ZPF4_9PSED|nr:hypothetical protein DM813_17385 [Pseudomonas alkylphenolica]